MNNYPNRRVAGFHDYRMDGLTDLVLRARGASVIDIGCNRGHVGLEMAHNGARIVHGCDIYEKGIELARENFADLRSVDSKFEVLDLTLGVEAFVSVFGTGTYDITIMLATYHKLRRVMPEDALHHLVGYFGRQTNKYFGWRGTSKQLTENEEEMAALDRIFELKLKRIHTSYISDELGVAAIWQRIY